MLTIKAVTTRKCNLAIDLVSLFQAITTYQGILLFSSNIPGGKNIAGFNPVLQVSEKNLRYHSTIEQVDNPFEVIDSVITHGSEIACPRGAGVGFLGYIAYDYKDRLEEAHLYKNPGQRMFPDLYFALFEHYLVFHTGSRSGRLVTVHPAFQYNPVHAGEILSLLSKPVEMTFTAKKSSYLRTSLPKQKYEDAVKKTIEYIKAGDIYQANITRAIYGKTGFTPGELGLRLYHSNRIEFGVFAAVEGKHIISTSPERFFKISHNKILTSPVKGTIRKTEDRETDRINKKELYASVKDRAELAMIVDLLRNDISKICRQGSVMVKRFPVLKELYNVYHLVADIEGTLLPEIRFDDIIRAVFPGGSISGCPKIRACQIIEELEKQGRGLYTGSFGYYTFGRTMDFNIMIRSLFLDGSSFIFNTGGGITLLSDPEKEYEETVYKAKNIWDALCLEDIEEERYCLKGKNR